SPSPFLLNSTPPSHIYTLSLHDALPIFHQVPGVIIHFHLDQHIARIKLALTLALLAIPHLNHFFGWHENLTKLFFQTLKRNAVPDRKSTRLNSSHVKISYAVFCLKKKNT